MMLVRDEEGNVIGKRDMQVKALLTILISDTLEYFSVRNSMSDSQLGQTINLLLEEYSPYKIDFFVYCFNCAKKGKYGTTFNRIDGQIIFDWLGFADADYVLEVEQQRVNEMKRLNHTNIGIPDPITSKNNEPLLEDKDKPVPMPEYVKDVIKSIGKKIVINKSENHITEQQRIINAYVDDFNKIFDEQDEGNGGKRFISFDFRMMDVSEYIEYRVKFDPINLI